MKTLMDYLPLLYENSGEVKAIQDALQPEISQLWADRDDLLAQLDVNSATWGLKYWEEAFGLPTYPEDDLGFRRSRVISMLRGTGTVTKELVENVSASFAHGEVKVVEQPAESTIEIHFISTLGLPPNLEDLKTALLEIMPAHLAIQYYIYFRMHADLSAHSHQQLAGYTHQTLREGAMN